MDWETLKSWMETSKNAGAIAEHTTRMVRRHLEKANERQTLAFGKRTRAVSKPGENQMTLGPSGA